MKVVLRLCAGIVLAVSFTGCHCMYSSYAPGGYSGYGGAAPADWSGCGGCGTNCTGYGGGYGGGYFGFTPVTGDMRGCAPPVDPRANPCMNSSRTGCCLLDGIGHILDSIHFGCGSCYGSPWVGYGNYGNNACGGCQPMYPGVVGAGAMPPPMMQDAPSTNQETDLGQPADP